MGGREEQEGQAVLVRGVGALVRGRGRMAGVDRGGHGIKRQICCLGYWQVSQKDGCFKGEKEP